MTKGQTVFKPKGTVLYNNLPTKSFNASQLLATEEVRLTNELLEEMRAAGHSFITDGTNTPQLAAVGWMPPAGIGAKPLFVIPRCLRRGGFILGSECDVLSLPRSEQEILRKVGAFMRCSCCG